MNRVVFGWAIIVTPVPDSLELRDVLSRDQPLAGDVLGEKRAVPPAPASPGSAGVETALREALARAERNALTILSSISDGFFAIDRQWRLTFVNSAAESILARSADDMVGRVLWEAFPGLVGSAFEPAYRRAMDERQSGRVVDFFPDHERYYEVTVEPYSDGISLCFRNVTEQRLAEDALRAAHDTFRHLVEHSPFGVYVVNADFRLVQVSAGAQKVFANVRPLLGRDFAEVLRIIWPEPFASEAIGRFRHTLATGEPYHAPSTLERRNDIDEVESYDWKIERLILPNGRAGVVCHFYDLSDRERYQAALKDADRRKDEFLAMLAHELRNPLAPIRTAVAVLRTRGDAGPSRGGCHDIIERQVAQMTRLLDDLLDVSRLSRGRLTLQRAPVGLQEILDAAIETSRPLLDQRGQHLGVDGDASGVVLDVDLARMTQVFANLLNNAAKYSPHSARVEIGVRTRDGRAIVEVRDRGIGIPPEMLDRVFDLFAQGLDARAYAPAGLGIGLSLARRLVEMHGGTIEVHSAGEGAGSTFTVSIPVASRTRPASGAAGSVTPGSALTKRRVMVVDDNTDAADTIAMLLETHGCEVRTVYDGLTAVHEAERFRPNVVLLDLGMPVMDGHEVCRRIRRGPAASATLVAVSGWGQQDDRQRSAEAGFDRHLTKPVDPDALLQVVRNA